MKTTDIHTLAATVTKELATSPIIIPYWNMIVLEILRISIPAIEAPFLSEINSIKDAVTSEDVDGAVVTAIEEVLVRLSRDSSA